MPTITILNSTTDSSRKVIVVPDIAGLAPSSLPQWRTFNIGAGNTSAPFSYTGALTAAARRKDGSTTADESVAIGSALRVVTAGQYLEINPGTNADLAMLNQGEAGLVNRTNPGELLDALWKIDALPSSTDVGLNAGSVSAIAPTGSLCFSTTTPTSAPRTKTVLMTAAVIRSNWTTIAIPQEVDTLTIVWSRASAGGADTFAIQS